MTEPVYDEPHCEYCGCEVCLPDDYDSDDYCCEECDGYKEAV